MTSGRGRPRPAGRRPAGSARTWPHVFSPAQHALLRGPRCARSCSGPEPTLLPGVFWVNLSARTTSRSSFKVARKLLCPCCHQIARALRLVHFPGTDRVGAVSFSVHYRSPLFPQLSFLCKHMCASFVLLLRARAPLSFAACAPALSSPPPMRPVRPCSANCIPYTCPWFPASMRRSCLSLRNPGTIFMTPPSHFAFYMSASAARFSMCSAHRWCSGVHRSITSALEMLCLPLGL